MGWQLNCKTPAAGWPLWWPAVDLPLNSVYVYSTELSSPLLIFHFPKKSGAVDDDHIIGEIGNVLAEKIKGRTSPQDITLFKSLVLAMEDVAADHFIYQKITAQGAGTRVEFNAVKKSV